MTVQHHSDIDIIDIAMRHEVMNIHVFNIDAGTVAHVIGIEITVKRQESTTLMGFDIGRVLSTISLHTTFGRHRWQTIVALYITW